MKMALRAAMGLVGLAGILIAVRLWLAPAETAGLLGLIPAGPLGLASLRADVGGFFAAGGALTLMAALRARGDLLTAPVLLLATALAGRIVTVFMNGYTADMTGPIAIEAGLIILLGAGRVMLAR